MSGAGASGPSPEAGAAGPGSPPAPGTVEELHRAAFVFDGHNDLALRLGDEPATGPAAGGHLDPGRMRQGGMDGGIFAVWVEPGPSDPLERTLRGVGRLASWLEAAPGLRPVRTAGDLEDARAAGEAAAVIGVEGAYGVEEELSALDRLFEAGVRCLTLTWMAPTAWADAAGAEPRHGGLTGFGGRVVERLEELGMVVDVSHAADATVEDVLARSVGPVVASHSGARAVADHPRNLPDRLLEGIAASGGVTGVPFFPAYLDEAWGRVCEAVREEMDQGLHTPEGRQALADRTAGLPPVGLGRIVDHVEHAVSVAGRGGVGLGSDFDGVPLLPDGMRDVRDLPRLTVRLARRGLSTGTLRAVLGDNFRRVLGEVLP